MMYCDACLDDCPPYDPETGLCESCRDELELRRMLDAMDEDQYAAFMHQRSAKQANFLLLSLKNLKLAS